MKKEINDALLDACRQRLLEKVNRCLSNGADPNTAGALETAVCGYPEIVEALLSAGANPNTAAKHGYYIRSRGSKSLYPAAGGTILMAAISATISVSPTLTADDYKPGAPWKSNTAVRTGKQPEIVKLLLSAGADPNATTKGDETALIRAVLVPYDNIQFVKLLLSADADPNAATEDGWTALMLEVAGQEANAEIVKLLLSAGADPNAAEKDGGTVLMRAAREGHAEIVRVLLSADAKTDAVDDGWNTALDIAKTEKHSEVVRILEEVRAK